MADLDGFIDNIDPENNPLSPNHNRNHTDQQNHNLQP